MQPALPPPTRPDGTPFPTLDNLFRAVITVPKTEIDKQEEQWKRATDKEAESVSIKRGLHRIFFVLATGWYLIGGAWLFWLWRRDTAVVDISTELTRRKRRMRHGCGQS